MKKFVIGTAKEEMAYLVNWTVWMFRVMIAILKRNTTPFYM